MCLDSQASVVAPVFVLAVGVGYHELLKRVESLGVVEQSGCCLHVVAELVGYAVLLTLVEVKHTAQLLRVAFLAVGQCHRLYVFLLTQEAQSLILANRQHLALVVRVVAHLPAFGGVFAEVRIKAVVVVLHTADGDLQAAALQKVALACGGSEEHQILLV